MFLQHFVKACVLYSHIFVQFLNHLVTSVNAYIYISLNVKEHLHENLKDIVFYA